MIFPYKASLTTLAVSDISAECHNEKWLAAFTTVCQSIGFFSRSDKRFWSFQATRAGMRLSRALYIDRNCALCHAQICLNCPNFFKVIIFLKFVFSKKATKIDKIFTAYLTLTTYIMSNRR